MAKNTSADALWEFAQTFYAKPGAESLCLRLQDTHGFDVCELIWLAWLCTQNQQCENAAIELTHLRQWQTEITQPLRAMRRELKIFSIKHTKIADIRLLIKEAELLAEREALNRLAAVPTQNDPAPIHLGETELAQRKMIRALNMAQTLKKHTSEATSDLNALFALWFGQQI